MNAKELADELERPNNWQQENNFTTQAATMLRQQEVEIERITSKYDEMLSQQQAEIEALNQRIERMIENASHHEGIAHAGGFETGYQAGLRKAQEK